LNEYDFNGYDQGFVKNIFESGQFLIETEGDGTCTGKINVKGITCTYGGTVNMSDDVRMGLIERGENYEENEV
jgi:hypothetical protein